MRRTTGRRASREQPRWRVGILDSDSRSRIEVSRLIEAGGGTCDVTSEALPTALIHTVPAVLEVVYRCPRCGRVVSRRRFGEWE